MRQVPILFLSDAVDQSSGLARITRDLCFLLAPRPEFRVGSLGLGGHGTRGLPWQQYHLNRYANGDYEYGELSLPAVWDDFTRGEPGILMTIWDLTRMLWLARPEHVEDESLRNWLEHARQHKFKLWSYLPIDATGPSDRLTALSREVLLGIDRILTYSPWARDVVLRTIGPEAAAQRGLEWFPHGLNLDVFCSLPAPDPVSQGVSHGPTGPVPEHVPDPNLADRPGGGPDSDPAGRMAPAAESLPPLDPVASPAGHDRDALHDPVHPVAGADGGAVPVALLADDRDPLEQAVDRLPGRAEAMTQAQIEGTAWLRGKLGEEAQVPQVVGVVATNQARKDWGLIAVVCAELHQRLGTKVKFWWHVDTVIRHWNILALIADRGLEDCVEITGPPMTDRELAARYCQCSLTLHPGLGEGFGYPIFESLACGVPVLHGNYAGGASILDTLGVSTIEPMAWRLDGQHNCVRPVFNPEDWVMWAVEFLKGSGTVPSVSHLHWTKLGPRFRRWFLDGLGEETNG